MTERFSSELSGLIDHRLLTPQKAESLYSRAMQDGFPHVAFQAAEWLIKNNGLDTQEKIVWQERSDRAFEEFASQAIDQFVKDW